MKTLGIMIFVGMAPLWLGIVSGAIGLTYEAIRWLLLGPRKPKPIDLALFYHEPPPHAGVRPSTPKGCIGHR